MTGTHILQSLLQNPAVVSVYCIVRAPSLEVGKQRLQESLEKQFIVLNIEEWNRVVIICGDTSAPFWGMNSQDIDTLRLSNIRGIIHNSAYVNHALKYNDLYPHNVESTLTGINLAADFTIASKGTPCHYSYVSTGGVCGRLSFINEETPLRLPVTSLITQNGYVQGKWVSECLMENAATYLSNSMQQTAMNATPLFSVFRPGAVSSHATTMASNVGDSLNRYIIGWCKIGAAPPLDPAAQVLEVSMLKYLFYNF